MVGRTPLALCHPESGELPFLDEVFCNSKPANVKSTSSVSAPMNTPSPCEGLRYNLKQHVTEEMLDEIVEICLSETDTISLLDMPITFVSEDTDDAEAIKEGNIHYAELCKNRKGSDKYVERAMQTFSGATKEKQTQTDKIVMVHEGSVATVCDIFDSVCDQNETSKGEKADYPECTVNISSGKEKRETSSSTVDADSTITSILEMEISGNSFKTEQALQLILLLESFQQSLLVMERSIVRNIFQRRLAAYRQLPILPDSDSTVKPETEEHGDCGEESSSSPTLEHLWAFSCELTRRCNINSMAWAMKDPVILAVGYGDCDSRNQKRGLVCCWSLKNIMWPERVFHCHSSVTSLDFSASNPFLLAVGMLDGTIAIYNVQIQNNNACIVTSSGCASKHLRPVWQVSWIKQELALSGVDESEALVSVSADGRVTKWLLCGNALTSMDLMKLKMIQNKQQKAAEDKEMTQNVLSAVTPGLCVDFHPTDTNVYLTGTWEGLIYKCSLSFRQHYLHTYQKHFCPVNSIEWSPFNSDVFLSCSSDWTIHLWKQDRSTPVLSFTSTQTEVYAIRWSPHWSTIFAAINEQQMEIWDLTVSIRAPTIVHHAAPGVRMTTLLFAKGRNSVLVGDSDGKVNVYKLKKLRVGEGKQVDILEDIIDSALLRLL